MGAVSKKFNILDNNADGDGLADKNKIILRTRVSLARNFTDKKFVSTSSNEEKKSLLEEVKKHIENAKNFKDFKFYRIKELKKLQRDLLFRDYMIDTEISGKMQGSGLLARDGLNGAGITAIIVNNEDHINIQSVCAGLNIYKAYNEVAMIEKYYEKKFNFAFDKDLGYLTASPFNLGTALRVTAIAHLPVLSLSSGISDLLKRMGKIGCQIKGYFIDSTEAAGNLFEIFNQYTLGKDEKEILDITNLICLNIAEEEKSARDQLKKKDLLGIKDNVCRSFGLLKYAKILSYEEAVELLSIMKIGKDLDIIDGVNDFDFFRLMDKISNSRIIVDMEIGGKIDNDYIDLIRAGIIRKEIMKEAG
jgi:protein arginine kinase